MIIESPVTWVELSRSNIVHNIKLHRVLLAKTTKLFVVVKSDAYGHGLHEIVSLIDHYVDGYCIAHTNEALILRTKTKKRIIVLSYFTTLNRSHILLCSKKGIELPVFSISSLLACIRSNTPLRVHIKIDTGTTRIGFLPEDVPHVLKKLNTKQLKIVGIFSHYAEAEKTSSTFTSLQHKRFIDLSEQISSAIGHHIEKHISCSAAIVQQPSASQHDLVRLGIHAYGLSGVLENNSTIKLKPVLSWKTRLIQIKKVTKGTSVGYNRTYIAPSERYIGTIPVGYWDGFDRRLSNNGHVLINGRFFPIVGNICMNMSMIDLGTTNPSEGTVVVLIGKQKQSSIHVDHMAKKIGTINYEITTRINQDIPRFTQ